MEPGFRKGGDAVEIDLANGQHRLGADAELCLPFDRRIPTASLRACHFDPAARRWRETASIPDPVQGCLRFKTGHFSLFGVLSGAAPSASDPAAPFGLGEVYVFPNPSGPGQEPSLHAELGAASSVEVKLFDVSGDLLRSLRIQGPPAYVDDGQGPELAYEEPLPGLASGTYFVVVEGSREGRGKLTKTFKFAVVK